jgi:hypothetical protein
MPLDKQQQEKLQKWLQSKGFRSSCPVCGANTWATGNIVSAPVHTSGGIALGGGLGPDGPACLWELCPRSSFRSGSHRSGLLADSSQQVRLTQASQRMLEHINRNARAL